MKLILNAQTSGANASRMVLEDATLFKPVVINLPIDCPRQRLSGPICGENVAGAVEMTLHVKRETGNRSPTRGDGERIGRSDIEAGNCSPVPATNQRYEAQKCQRRSHALCRRMLVMRRGGPSASGMKQDQNPTVASITLVRRPHHSLALPIEENHNELPVGGVSANVTRTLYLWPRCKTLPSRSPAFVRFHVRM